MSTMQIVLNGKPHSLDQSKTLSELINELGLTGKRIAVEHNLNIIPRSQLNEVVIAENDRIEIVAAIGGG